MRCQNCHRGEYVYAGKLTLCSDCYKKYSLAREYLRRYCSLLAGFRRSK